MATWKDGCKPTRHPGIYRTETGYRVRVRAVDPRTGMQKERNEEFPNLTIEEALAKKAELRKEIEKGAVVGERVRVGEFARYWIECKAGTIDRKTAEHYADALDSHALPYLGKLYFDTIRSMDVQSWINAVVRKGYAVATVHSYFRAFRVMVRDAIVQLDLPRDPTMRITFPDRGERDEANALTPEQLAKFLGEVRARHERHYALVATLAYTGLRFCHASALRWEDIDEEQGIIRIVRKQNRGHVAPVSRKKRAPKQYPLDPVLAEVLKEHRRQMIENQAPGLETGYVFPSKWGTLRTPSGLWKATRECLAAAGIRERFTVHGLRRTFNDLSRRAGVDAVVTKALTGHVSEKMREHYSTVRMDEKREAVAKVLKLVSNGDGSGDGCSEGKKTGTEGGA